MQAKDIVVEGNLPSGIVECINAEIQKHLADIDYDNLNPLQQEVIRAMLLQSLNSLKKEAA